MTSLLRVLVTWQQVLVSTVNTSSVDDDKENKVILNGRLRSFVHLISPLNKERLSSSCSLNGTLYYIFDQNKLNFPRSLIVTVSHLKLHHRVDAQMCSYLHSTVMMFLSCTVYEMFNVE